MPFPRQKVPMKAKIAGIIVVIMGLGAGALSPTATGEWVITLLLAAVILVGVGIVTTLGGLTFQ